MSNLYCQLVYENSRKSNTLHLSSTWDTMLVKISDPPKWQAMTLKMLSYEILYYYEIKIQFCRKITLRLGVILGFFDNTLLLPDNYLWTEGESWNVHHYEGRADSLSLDNLVSWSMSRVNIDLLAPRDESTLRCTLTFKYYTCSFICHYILNVYKLLNRTVVLEF